MGTEVLYPQDFLIRPVRISSAVFHRGRKSSVGNGNSRSSNTNNHKRKQSIRSDNRKGSPEPEVSKRSAMYEDLLPRPRPNRLVMGQVTILRRGESLDSKLKDDDRELLRRSGDEMIVFGTGRLGPAPEMVPRQLKMSPAFIATGDVYAGSAFSLSPSPRALPLPSFFHKKIGSNTVDDFATEGLRRLLRLE